MDYDLFDYKHFDEPQLALDEAIKAAGLLKKSDPVHFHRIVPADSDLKAFRVESISREARYVQTLSRWTGLWNRFLGHSAQSR